MLLATGHSWLPERSLARWSCALLAIVACHGGAIAAGLMTWQMAMRPIRPPAAIMMELMPLPVAPPAPQTQAMPEPRLPEPQPTPLSEPEPALEPGPMPEIALPPPMDIAEVPLALRTPEVALPKSAPEKPKIEHKVEKPKDKPKEIPKAEKTKERPPTKPQEKPKDKPQEKPTAKPDPENDPLLAGQSIPAPAQAAASTAAPVQRAAVAAAPSAADIARRASAEANWQGLLLAHLGKFKRYPKSAQRRNLEGTPLLRVRMDRAGRVLSFALERTSGHESLDKEVLALIERAEPLPALPPEMTQATIEIVVPVDFNLKTR